MKVIYALEDMPETFTKSIFLAGPTPRNREEQDSWRPDAIKILEDKGYDGVVFIPEPREVKSGYDYNAQVEWEEKYLHIADCIVFWVPRDLEPDSKGHPKMAAFTTNVEWGAWCDSGKVVFGAPPKATKNTYLKHYADKYNVTVSDTLPDTLDSAMEMLGNGAERTGGEREVPLFIWNTPSFQSWYQQLKGADNRLDGAQLLYTFRPRFKNFVFLWVLKVNVYVSSEDRNKTNEFVLARPDISSVLMWQPNTDVPLDSKVILIKEFRSSARTEDGFIRELPSGSSHNDLDSDTEIASQEIHEETGIHIEASRFKLHTRRQLCATLSSHKSSLFSVELTDDELKYLEAQKDIPHGLVDDSEITFVEIYTVKEIIENQNIDFSNLGMILSIVYNY